MKALLIKYCRNKIDFSAALTLKPIVTLNAVASIRNASSEDRNFFMIFHLILKFKTAVLL